ncbi:MAG: hypothetical protein K6U87_04085 [Firmicutes bacterium]|nr:hypothetical protein [Bacillota bacterium]
MAPHLSAILAAWASVSELPSPEAWVKELDALSWTFFSMAGWAVILRAAAMAWATTSPPVVRLLEALETYAPPPVRRPRVPVHGLPNASSWPVLAGVWQTMLLEPGDLSPWELRVTARTLAQWPVLTVWTVWDWDPNDPTDSLALETVERRLVRICEAVPQPTRQGLQLAAAVADLLAEGATGTPEGTPKRPWSVLAQWCRDQEARWLT